MSTSKRVALVTGGSRGIGLAISNCLQQSGIQVVVGSRSVGDKSFASHLDKELEDGVMALALDVCSADSVENTVQKIKQQFGAINILVNCAGISVHQTVVGHCDEQWERVIDTNLNGCYRTIRCCLPDMIGTGWGRIVNIASTAAHTAVPTHAAYCASKAGLLGLTRAVALEGAPHGVNCVSVSPTWVETPMLQDSVRIMAANSKRSESLVWDEIAAANPQDRLVQAQEIAELVTFLCSDACSALTMEDIKVNAGAHW